MGLYLAIVLLALLVGFGAGDERWDEVALIWSATIGLGIAHLFAFRIVSVLATGGRPESEAYWATLGMVGAVVATGAVATVPYLISSDTTDASRASTVLLMGVIGVAGYASARHAGATTLHSLLFTAAALVGAAIATVVEVLLTH